MFTFAVGFKFSSIRSSFLFHVQANFPDADFAGNIQSLIKVCFFQRAFFRQFKVEVSPWRFLSFFWLKSRSLLFHALLPVRKPKAALQIFSIKKFFPFSFRSHCMMKLVMLFMLMIVHLNRCPNTSDTWNFMTFFVKVLFSFIIG